MNEAAANPADELTLLREQLALQQKLLAEKEAQLQDKDTLLSEHAAQLERKQLLLDESNEHLAWLEETLALLKSKRYRHSCQCQLKIPQMCQSKTPHFRALFTELLVREQPYFSSGSRVYV